MSPDLFEWSWWLQVFWKTIFISLWIGLYQLYMRPKFKKYLVDKKKLSKWEAAAEYDRIADELGHLHSSASNHISRRDNNWQFELQYSLRHVAKRIRQEYAGGDYKGGGPTVEPTGDEDGHRSG